MAGQPLHICPSAGRGWPRLTEAALSLLWRWLLWRCLGVLESEGVLAEAAGRLLSTQRGNSRSASPTYPSPSRSKTSKASAASPGFLGGQIDQLTGRRLRELWPCWMMPK